MRWGVMRSTLLWLALGLAPARAQAPPNAPEVRTYVVQPGDSAWSIAAEFYGAGDKYPIIYEYNDFVARPPFLLKPGQLLRLPILGQGPAAQLEWLQRDVKAKPPRALDWLEAREQMNLWRLYRVQTGDESAAHIVFEDLSDLKLRENALLVIYGASASAARTTRRDKVEVMLEEGTLVGGLAALDEAAGVAPMVVRTPSGEIDLLARLAQVQAELGSAIVSVFDGQATVRAQGDAVEVAGGQGTVVKKGRPPERARPLPEAPTWAQAGPALVVVVAGHTGTWEAAWKPAARAASYRVELARDETFKQLLYDAEVGAGVNRLRLAELAPGRYAVRIATRDLDKLESVPGEVRALEVVALLPARALSRADDGVIEGVGFARLEVPEAARARMQTRVGDGPARQASEPISLGPGTHELRFEERESGAEARLTVRVLEVAARIEVEGEPIARDAEAIVRLQVSDARGREAHLPGIALETSRGEVLPLTREGGGYVARVGPAAPGERVAVRARWTGGALGVREIVHAPEEIAERAPRTPIAFSAYRPSRFAPGPLAAALPESRVGLEATAAHIEGGPGQVTLALDGELALGPWGLGARFTAQEIRLAEGQDAQSRPQDLALWARRGFVGEHFVITPHLRMSFPIGLGHEDRLAQVELGLGARLGRGSIFFDARAAALIVPGARERPGLVADVLGALGWQANEALTLALSAEGLGDLVGGAWQSLVGIGAAVEIGDLRLGLGLGLGVGEASKRDMGAVLGRLLVEVGGVW